jgi:hypothetical protein
MGRPKAGVTLEERFQHKVLRGAPDECWPWQGVPNKKGYGRIVTGARAEMAHRVAWKLAFGPIPEGMLVLHSCDNPPCCNPRHLFLGDDLVNAQDREAKGRGHCKTGERNSRAKLTTRKVRTLRAVYASRLFDQYQLAEIYQVSQGVVSKIVRRVIWGHV